MTRASVLFVVGEGSASAVDRLMRGNPRVAHVVMTRGAAMRTILRWRAIGVAVIEADTESAPALETLAELRRLRPGLRAVMLAGHRALGDIIGGATDVRIVAAPWNDRMLLAAVDGAATEAETLRRARLSERLAARRLTRIKQLEASGSSFSSESAKGLADANARLRQSAVGLARLVAVLAEGGDPALSSRRERVARTAVALARRMNWPLADVEDARMAALLADVGRAWCAGGAAAFDLEGAHAERSAAALAPLPFSRAVIAGVRHHHERWDGMGAPAALRGTEIPRLARLLALAEAYVGYLEGDDIYEGLSEQEAATEIAGEAARAHDPQMVEALLFMVEAGTGQSVRPELELARVRS